MLITTDNDQTACHHITPTMLYAAADNSSMSEINKKKPKVIWENRVATRHGRE